VIVIVRVSLSNGSAWAKALDVVRVGCALRLCPPYLLLL